jgi:hypothetical protein
VFTCWTIYSLERIGGEMAGEHVIPEEIKATARLAALAAHLYWM